MIKDINFLDIDNNLYEKDFENYYYLETIYIIYYNNKKKNVSVSYGTINNINNFEIKYSGNLVDNAKIAPIFNLSNNKIIGIHKTNSIYHNEGIFLKKIIHDFINYYTIKKKINEKIYNKKIKNIININIDMTDFKEQEKIFFLYNYELEDDEGKYNSHNNLKELNSNNTEIYINNKKHDFSKFFIPKKKGSYNITLKFNINLKDCSFMFAGCSMIKQINFINFDTSNTYNMKYMFANCKKLENINLYSLNTKNVINMSNMFYNCSNIISLDLSSFDTKNVVNINHIFADCKKLEDINIDFFNSDKVSNMSYMFYNCLQLKNINLSSFGTKNVLDMSYMFYNCSKLINLDLSSFNTKKVNNMSNMFFGCERLVNLNLTTFDTKNVIDISKMFFYCHSLKNLDLSSFDFTNVENIIDIFINCGRFNNVDLSILNNNMINYATEFVILFINGSQKDEQEDYLIHKLESLKFFQEKGDIIKFKGKIIFYFKNKCYILNLVKFKNQNKDIKPDLLILEYNLNEIESFINIVTIWNKLNETNIPNSPILTYLIGISFETKESQFINEADDFCNLNKNEHILISTKNENVIKYLLNKILTNLKNQEKLEDMNFNIIFLDGKAYGVGKTSIIKRIIDNKFDESSLLNFRSDYSKTIYLKTGNKACLNFIDTNIFKNNKEQLFQHIKESYFIILVYDVTRKNTFEEIKNLYQKILDLYGTEKIIYLIGNKIDLNEKNKKDIQIRNKEVLEFAQFNCLKFFQISCKENIGINEFFCDLCNEVAKVVKYNNIEKKNNENDLSFLPGIPCITF